MSAPITSIDSFTKLNGPGLCYMVLQDQKIIETKSLGYADIQAKIQIDADTVFNIASNSKAITAACLLIAEREDKVSPDDFLVNFVPELPAYASAIKVRDLIYHSSGLPDYGHICDSTNPVTNKEVIEFLSTATGLCFDSGTRYEYSNSGYVMLAEVLHRATGKKFPSLVKEQIFDPLDMSGSWVIDLENEQTNSKRARGYGYGPPFNVNDFSNGDFVFGDGGIMMSIKDFSKWAIALSSQGLFSGIELTKIFTPGKTGAGNLLSVVPSEGGFSVDKLEKVLNPASLCSEGNPSYGYGWILANIDRTPIYLHGGSWLGYRSAAAYVPTKKLWIAFFSNYQGTCRESILGELLRKYL